MATIQVNSKCFRISYKHTTLPKCSAMAHQCASTANFKMQVAIFQCKTATNDTNLVLLLWMNECAPSLVTMQTIYAQYECGFKLLFRRSYLSLSLSLSLRHRKSFGRKSFVVLYLILRLLRISLGRFAFSKYFWHCFSHNKM